MRLICPNCGAQYEVDDSLIPETGRDVQCSNCGHGWFQRPPHLDRDLASEMGLAPEPADEAEDEAPEEPPPPRPAPRLDPQVRSILEEEAEREAHARRGEARIETQSELALDQVPPPPPRERVASRPLAPGAEERGEAASRRDLLPDIEEINSSLRSAEERGEMVAEPAPAEPRRRSGFGTGFLIVVLVAVLAIALYLWADQIAAAIPQAEPMLTAYVDWADRARLWLDGLAQDWVRRLSGMTDSIREGE